MKLIKYFKSDLSTDDAHQLCLDIEADLGANLHYDGTNDVHGYMNTGSDGDVEIYLYEPEDIVAIDAHPDQIIDGKVKKTKSDVPRKHCTLTDGQIKTRLDRALKQNKGFIDHPDMNGKAIKRVNAFGFEV